MTEPKSPAQGAIPGTVNLVQWVEENRHFLKPPVGNKVIWKDADLIVMAVGGPNSRTDYHYDPAPEFFYQLHGDLLLKTMTPDGREDITVAEGEMFVLPARLPHSPQRFENTVGLVVEQIRRPGERDGLMWFCQRCDTKLYEEYFQLEDIETQFQGVFERYNNSESRRTCDRCGFVNPVE